MRNASAYPFEFVDPKDGDISTETFDWVVIQGVIDTPKPAHLGDGGSSF